VDKIQKIKLSEIRPAQVNCEIYNAPTEDHIIKLANSIKRKGLLHPLLVTKDNVIISGHTRYKALCILKRTFVEIRYADISSDDPNFNEYLVEANIQRVKTDAENMREISATCDPIAYQYERAQISRESNFLGLKKVEGELKAERKISENYKELHEAILKIIEQHKQYLPITVRRLHYLLLNDPPVISAKSGEKYDNKKAHYQLLSKETTTLRVHGKIAFLSIVDKTRKLITNRGFENMTYYVNYEAQRFLKGYYRDLMQTQPFYIAIICEKETVSNQLDEIANEFGIPVIYSKGSSSIDARFRLLNDWQYNGEKPIRLLFLSDLDPAGYRIQDSFVGSLKKDFFEMVKSTPIEAYRAGITQEQVIKYNLFSNMDAKETDTNYKKFIQETGMRKTYELDALSPEIFTREAKNSILKIIDTDLFNIEVSKMNKELSKLNQLRANFLHTLKIDTSI
jgi:hypothetical protein